MRDFIYSLLFLSASLVSCKDQTKFIIKGSISNAADNKKVYLYKTDSIGQAAVVDSAFLNEDQEFTFESKSAQPDIFQLVIAQQPYMIIAKNGDRINFSTNLSNPAEGYKLEGGEESDKITEFNKVTASYSSKIGDLSNKYGLMVQQRPLSRDSILNIFNRESAEISKVFLKQSYHFITNNKTSLTAFYAANMILNTDAASYEKELIAYAGEIKNRYPSNPAIQGFVKQMEVQAKTAVGQIAPEIAAFTPDEQLMSLSSFKGKYVLLDFWASWCAPCRAENPNIVKQYQAFKNKNFTVFGVSLDDDKNKWKEAIIKDQLSWNHVSELQQWESPSARLYNINAIPASFIIDPAGKIIAKNLRGNDLEVFLSKVLKDAKNL